MRFELLLPWLMATALMSVRIGIAFALSPALTSHGIPSIARLALVLALAALLTSPGVVVVAAAAAAGASVSPGQLLLAVGAEIVIGALLGLGVHVVLAAFAMAGRLLDVQIGFGIGSVFDPVTRSSTNAMGALMSMLAVVLFFVSDAHLELIRILAASTAVLPLGVFPDLADPLKPALAAGAMFSLGLALTAPVAIALVITDLAVGVAARNMPQINLLVLSIPVKILVAYLVLGLSIVGWSPLVRQGFALAGDVLGSRR